MFFTIGEEGINHCGLQSIEHRIFIKYVLRQRISTIYIMGIKLFFIIMFLLTMSRFSMAQQAIGFDDLSLIKPTITTENKKKYKGRVLISSVEEGNVLISFKELFNDSIKVYLNDEFLRIYFVISDSVILGTSNTAFKISLKNRRRTKVVFVLPEKKVYIKFMVSRKYKLIKVFKDDNRWRLIRTNYVPEYM
jgi:hypothetical protein